jgi:hypothetical protein
VVDGRLSAPHILQMMVLLGAVQSGRDLSLMVFGLHLLILGMLVFQSNKRLGVLGILVIAARLGDGLSPEVAYAYTMFSVRPRCVLTWLAEGKGMPEIAPAAADADDDLGGRLDCTSGDNLSALQ